MLQAAGLALDFIAERQGRDPMRVGCAGRRFATVVCAVIADKCFRLLVTIHCPNEIRDNPNPKVHKAEPCQRIMLIADEAIGHQ